MMKLVKLIKCSDKSYWYSNRIGQTFPVIKDNMLGKDWYKIFGQNFLLRREDCEDIEEEVDVSVWGKICCAC